MVFGVKPVCEKCHATESTLWQRNESEQVVCCECYKSTSSTSTTSTTTTSSTSTSTTTSSSNNSGKETTTAPVKREEDEDGAASSAAAAGGATVGGAAGDEGTEQDEGMKDAEWSNGKDDEQGGDKDKDAGRCSDKRETKRRTRKGRQGGKGSVPKGKGRRYIFKKSATKAPAAVATPVTSDYLFCKGLYYQIGDIVSLIDVDGGTYYAQIRGLLQDQYCEKSAVLTWLLPTKASPPPHLGFDPSTYIIGPEEDIPRKLEYMEFELHAPSDYFKDRTSPYSTMTYRPESCFVWSRLGGPQIKPIEKAKELLNK